MGRGVGKIKEYIDVFGGEEGVCSLPNGVVCRAYKNPVIICAVYALLLAVLIEAISRIRIVEHVLSIDL